MMTSQSSAVLLAALALLATIAPGRTEPNASVCVYASKSYSDGAFLCVQKSVALICRSDSGHLAWATVTDKDMADRCTTPEPAIRPEAQVRPHHARIRSAFRMRYRDAVISPSRCFDFSGKHYCE